MDASMSTVPTSRSSVTPRGICTKGASRIFLWISPDPIFSRSPACATSAGSVSVCVSLCCQKDTKDLPPRPGGRRGRSCKCCSRRPRWGAAVNAAHAP
jgi:hypothetical protein